MRALQSAYKASHAIDKNTAYVFVLKEGGTSYKAVDLQGIMPRGRQFGYLFTKSAGKDAPWVIAHELAHGVFTLRHTFDSFYGGVLKQGDTDNLMDYSDGTFLGKWQWDIIGAPAIWTSPFAADAKSEAVAAERISDFIDYDKLVKWLRDNRGKTVQYHFKDFLSQEITDDPSHLSYIPINKPYTEVVNGKTIQLTLKGSLSTKNGTVTLDSANTSIPLFIDFKENHIEYHDRTFFDGQPLPSGQREIAIDLYTNDIDDFEYLLYLQQYTVGAGNFNYYTKKFIEAFKAANNDCDKIDILWENIPDQVAKSLPDDLKWDNLKSLNGCFVDRIGTNEEIGIVRLLKSLDGSYLARKVDGDYDDAEMLSTLFGRLSDENQVKCIAAITSSLDATWINVTPHKVYMELVNPEAPKESLIAMAGGKASVVDLMIYSYSICSHEKGTNKYRFEDSPYTINAHGEIEECDYPGPVSLIHEFHGGYNIFEASPSHPILTDFGGSGIIMPAFLVDALMYKRGAVVRNNALSLSIGMLMPELLISKANLSKWGNLLKGGTSNSISKFVDKLKLGKFIKKIGDYEVYENGEVFYRGMSSEAFNTLKQTGKLVPSSETFTSPTLNYVKAVGYGDKGVVVKFQMKHGTLDELQTIGVRNDGSDKLMQYYPNMQKSKAGWVNDNKALFKTEGTKRNMMQINIGLGKGKAVDIFNNNIIHFEIIQ
jgi:hypothetical protein